MTAQSKLDLLEFLLGKADFGECAQRAIEWMGEYVGVKQALCVAVDADPTRMVGIAGHGISSAKVSRFSLDLDNQGSAVVAALTGVGSVEIRSRRSELAALFDESPLRVVPLRVPDSNTAPTGLVFTLPIPRESERDVRWLTGFLSQKLAQLYTFRTLAAAEESLSRERTLLSSVINAVPDPILLTDQEGRMILANARAEALFGAQEAESEGRRRAVALNNMLISAGLAQRAIEAIEPAARELPLVNPEEGSDILFEFLTATIAGPREEIGLVSILRNVTDLRRATQEIQDNYQKLREAEAHVRAERDRLDLIIDSVADPILVTNPAGNIVLMNSPAERLFTVPESDPPRGAERAVRANDAHFSSFVSNLFFTGAGLRWRGEVNLTDPQGGGNVPMEAISGKILSEQGEVTAVVTILHDRTEELEKARLYEQLKRASDELEGKVQEATSELVHQNELLQRQHIQLEQASALKSQFLANLSHEFRTPLNAILGYTSMLLVGVSGELTPPQKKNLTRVDTNARHLLSIINDILDISRIEAGRMPLHLESFDLPQLITEVLQQVEPIIVRSKLAVKKKVPERMGAFRSDRQKVKQIVLNLLTNALKFTRQGSVTVTASHDRAHDIVTVAVSDTGIGIAPEDQEKVFEDFRQVDPSPSREYSGTGLGLSICRRLATMIDGKITLESELGQGATFTLTLPRRVKRRS